MPETAAAMQGADSSLENAAAWARVRNLECNLTVEVPLPGVTVRDFVQSRSGWVMDSHWEVSADVPLLVNGVLIAWGEFEVVAGKLAMRITELASQNEE